MLCGLLLELHLRVAIAAHDCRGHSKEKDGHADDRTNDSCDSFHNAVSLPRWDSGAAQNVIDLFPAAKREQRSGKAKSLSAALFDVHLCGVKLYPYVKSKTQTQMHEFASCFCPYRLHPHDTLCTSGAKQLKLLGFSRRYLFWFY